MSIDAWIYCKPAAWSALSPTDEWPALSPTDEWPALSPTDEWPVLSPMDDWRYTYDSAVTGFWKPYLVDFEVYNVLGSVEQIQSIVGELDPLDNPHTFAWVQGLGYDSLDQWPTIPAEVLAVMKDHVTYDDAGNETSRTPATQLNPNWGHEFLGQKQRIFAGDFNDAFNGDFL